MESTVKDLLEELYLLEPNLRKQEKHLTEIVTLMLKNVPKSEMNIEFKKELKQKILTRIHAKKNTYTIFYFSLLSGLSLCGVFLLVGINMFNSFLGKSTMSFVPHIERADDGAFGGDIKTTSQGGGAPEYAGNAGMRMMAVGKISEDMTMPINNPIVYEYSYTGKLTIPTEKLTVYKRNSVGFDTTDTSEFIHNLHIDGLNLSALKNAGISSINISEDQEFGYNIGIDFIAGNVTFYQNYAKWPQTKCDTNGCQEPVKLTEKDIPTDDQIIHMADEFIIKYNIDKKLYGSPIVNSEWRTNYIQQKQEGIEVYIPETYTVVYPIKIDNTFIYEEYGGYKGIIFTIDIRNKRVSNVTGLEKYNLIASRYPAISESKIQEMIVSGGRNTIENIGTGNVVKLTLSEPISGYVRIYGESKDGISNDFLVPAYIFKVQDKPVDSYVPDTVIVPLVEGFTRVVLSNLGEERAIMK